MSFDLKSIKRTKSLLPPRTTLYGPPKLGKSTFAGCAPKPIFIQTEDGLESIDADAFPLCQSWEEIMNAVAVLYNDPHEFKTVVVDSADWAEKLLHKYVVAEAKKEKATIEGIEDLGYGKGYVRAAEIFSELLDGLNALRVERGMGVVVICHADIKRFDDPLSNSYDRYQMKLHRQVGKLLVEWSDVLALGQVSTVTAVEKKDDFKKTERTRALTTGQRVMRTSPSPAYDAGNRYGLPDTIDLTWEAYEAALNAARGITTEQPIHAVK